MPDQTGAIKPRRAFVAVFLSLGATGLGHVYCGNLTKGLVLFFLGFAFVPAIGLAARQAPSGAVLFLAAGCVLLYFALFAYAAVDAALLARKKGRAYALKEYNRWFVYALFILFTAFYPSTYADIIRSHVLQPFKIPTASMAPGILPGDFLLLNKFVYERQSPGRGEVVIFNHPNERHKMYIKRIVALPGDTVAVHDGLALVNGRPLSQGPVDRTPLPDGVAGPGASVVKERDDGVGYLVITPGPGDGGTDLPETMVPNGHCFVLADNRGAGEDSRTFGPIPLADIQGRVDYIYFPAKTWKRFGPLGGS